MNAVEEVNPGSKPPWNPRVAGGAAVLLGPAAGGLVAWQNLRRLGQPERARRVLAWTIAASTLILAVLLYLPGELSKFFGLGVQAAGAALFPSLQRAAFERWKASHSQTAEANGWSATGWGLIGLALFMGLGFGILSARDYWSESTLKRAEAYRKREQFAQAEKNFRLASWIDPESALPHFGLAECLVRQKEWDQAITEYRAGLKIMPRLAEAHAELGQTFDAKGDANSAIGELHEATRLKPNFFSAHNLLGRILLDEKHDARAAVAEFREITHLEPENGDAHCLLGKALFQNDQTPAAIDELIAASHLGTQMPGCKDPLWKMLGTSSKGLKPKH